MVEICLDEKVWFECGDARMTIRIAFLLGKHSATESLFPFGSRTVRDGCNLFEIVSLLLCAITDWHSRLASFMPL